MSEKKNVVSLESLFSDLADAHFPKYVLPYSLTWTVTI